MYFNKYVRANLLLFVFFFQINMLNPSAVLWGQWPIVKLLTTSSTILICCEKKIIIIIISFTLNPFLICWNTVLKIAYIRTTTETAHMPGLHSHPYTLYLSNTSSKEQQCGGWNQVQFTKLISFDIGQFTLLCWLLCSKWNVKSLVLIAELQFSITKLSQVSHCQKHT